MKVTQLLEARTIRMCAENYEYQFKFLQLIDD